MTSASYRSATFQAEYSDCEENKGALDLLQDIYFEIYQHQKYEISFKTLNTEEQNNGSVLNISFQKAILLLLPLF